MRKTALILTAGVIAAVLTGCTKRCACVSYDSTVRYFTPEEVEARSTSCTDMIYLDHIRYFSLCKWTYKDEN